MNFTLSPEQELLGKAAAQFCADHAPASPDHALAWELDRMTWRRAGEIGFFALRGDGQGRRGFPGTVDAAIVAMESARALFPGPVTASMLAGELLPAAANGEVVVTAARRPPSGPVTAEHLASADLMLVFDLQRVSVVEVGSLDWTPVEAVDPYTPVGSVPSLPSGMTVAEGAAATGLEQFARVLQAAELAGLARRACAEATGYARAREQFGRAIGSFQAVKHLLADMAVEAELARAAVLYAAGVLEAGSGSDAERWALSTVVVSENAAIKNAEACIQIHGAMGYAWETGVHLILRRAWAIAERNRVLDPCGDRGAALLGSAGSGAPAREQR